MNSVVSTNKLEQLQQNLQQQFADIINCIEIKHEELTLETNAEHLHTLCLKLRDDAVFKFNMLIDICGIDYLHYGIGEWETQRATYTGFDRAVEPLKQTAWDKPRFAVVYHLLSLTHNHRLRIRVFVPEAQLVINSVIDIWPAADWFEREAFDLFGILFEGHPDLRRILTDYGFIGHPFRKDFPLIGNVEMRYDATLKRCVYEPVSIKARTLVPKVIRKDNRYISGE